MRNALLSLTLMAGLTAGTLAQAQDPTTEHQTGDPAMTAAMAEARGSLDKVFAVAMNDAGALHPAIFLKVAVPVETTDITVENIWVNAATRNNGSFSATLANAPVYFDARQGDAIRFTKDQIVDWSFSDNGTLYGNYTTRVQLPLMDAQTRGALQSQLSENPLPDGW